MTQDRVTIRTKHATIKTKGGTTNLTNTNLQGIYNLYIVETTL